MEKHVLMADSAKKITDFYKTLYKDFDEITQRSFNKLPLISKKNIQDNMKDFLSGSILEDNLIVYNTSGTTGIPLEIYWNKKEYTKSMFCLWNLRRKWYGILPNDKYCTFHSVVSNGDDIQHSEIVAIHNGQILSLGRYCYSDDVIKKYISYIKEFEPKWIMGPPSVLMLIAEYLEKKHQYIDSLKYIELAGEYVEPEIKNYIQKLFNIPVSNMYGSVEFNGIALTCPYGTMHIMENNVYVETIKEAEFDSIVITGLNNSFMPLVRYKLGDVGKIYANQKCQCGKAGRCLDLKRGRIHELICIDNRKFLDPDIVKNLVEKINSGKFLVKQFYLVKTNSEYILNLVSNKEDFEEIIRRIPVTYEKLINSKINFKIKLVEKYEENNLKFTYFVDNTN